MIKLLLLLRSISNYIYIGLLTIIAVFLPFSVFVVSAAEIGLLVNLIVQGDYKEKFKALLSRKSVLVFLTIYAVHILWLLGSSDLAYAFLNLKIKLPLLVLPLIIALSLPLDTSRLKFFLSFFIASVFTATIVSTLIYLGFTPLEINDVRNISIFISHIRLSLLIVIAILVLLKWIIDEGFRITKTQILKFLLMAWLIIFLMILKSFTGLIVLSVTALVLGYSFIRSIKYRIIKTALIILLAVIPILAFLILRNEVIDFYDIEKVDVAALEKKSENGNPYYHDPADWNVENGKKVWMYVCQPELRREWNKRSNFKYDSLDKKNQPVAYTLIRYMTSVGLKKDSAGVSKLKTEDILRIENGMTNVIYSGKLRFKPRIYEVIWELDQYRHGAAVNTHSVTQRIIYMQIALELIRANFWFGIGTGDLPMKYSEYYQTHETGLSKDRQFHTHNEFLRLFATFGVFGFLIIMAAFFIPVFIEKKWSSYYMIMIITIILLSFLNEDTLESQIGVTFSLLFYSVFLWGYRSEKE
jgi:hypothetical protein